ncbi:60S ribosomal protein L29-1 [Zea mays]|nr:60S ribosomal protein L29-1 [Zea mays]
MAKSKDHMAHNQSYKAHKNNIKKPMRGCQTSTKGSRASLMRLGSCVVGSVHEEHWFSLIYFFRFCQALLHASVALDRKLVVDWVPSCDLEDSAAEENLDAYEKAWELLKLHGANSTEFDPTTKTPCVIFMPEDHFDILSFELIPMYRGW